MAISFICAVTRDCSHEHNFTSFHSSYLEIIGDMRVFPLTWSLPIYLYLCSGHKDLNIERIYFSFLFLCKEICQWYLIDLMDIWRFFSSFWLPLQKPYTSVRQNEVCSRLVWYEIKSVSHNQYIFNRLEWHWRGNVITHCREVRAGIVLWNLCLHFICMHGSPSIFFYTAVKVSL